MNVSDGADTTTGTVNVTVNDDPGGGPIALLVDDFNDGDFNGWTVVEQGTNRAPSSWSASSCVMTQSSIIYGTPESGLPKLGTYARVDGGTSWTDYRARLTIRSASSQEIGFMFRINNGSNYYRFSWNRASSSRRLVKNVNGVFTLLEGDSVDPLLLSSPLVLGLRRAPRRRSTVSLPGLLSEIMNDI